MSKSTTAHSLKGRKRSASSHSHGDPDDDDHDDADPTLEEYSVMSRSERKKHREKKRRKQVNRGFDELVAILTQIDPTIFVHSSTSTNTLNSSTQSVMEEENREEEEQSSTTANAKQESGRRTNEDDANHCGMSRVELIAKTVQVLRGVHTENQRLKRQVEMLRGGREKDRSAATTTATGTTPSNATLASSAVNMKMLNGRIPLLLPYLTPSPSPGVLGGVMPGGGTTMRSSSSGSSNTTTSDFLPQPSAMPLTAPYLYNGNGPPSLGIPPLPSFGPPSAPSYDTNMSMARQRRRLAPEHTIRGGGAGGTK